MAPEQRRAVILDAATGLFASQGYRGTSVDQIADASAVTPPVIYDHFDSKLELYRETLAHHFAALRSTWAKGLAAESTKESVAAGSTAGPPTSRPIPTPAVCFSGRPATTSRSLPSMPR